MDLRKGFDRLSRLFLWTAWTIFLIVGITSESAARFGENLVYMLFFTGGFMLLCKGVAWVYSGFVGQGTKDQTP